MYVHWIVLSQDVMVIVHEMFHVEENHLANHRLRWLPTVIIL